MKISILLTFILLLPAIHAACSGSASYSLEIIPRWTSPLFASVPPVRTLSPFTAFSHKNRFSAWALYGYATPAVQAIAETGNNTALRSDLASAMTSGFVKHVATRPMGSGPAQRFALELVVDCENHYVSGISMLAPSPDWFVAVTRANILDQDGNFRDFVRGRLFVYDAGTDSGDTFAAANMETVPKENIVRFMGPPFEQRLGVYKLRKLGA